MSVTNILCWGRGNDGQTGLDRPDSLSKEPFNKAIDKQTSIHNYEQDNPSVFSPTLVQDVNIPNLKGKDITDGSHSQDPSPYPSPILKIIFSEISCGSRHTLALDNEGTAWSWGWGLCGQLGHGLNQSLSKPCQIKALRENKENDFTFPGLTCISAGGMHSAAVDRGKVILLSKIFFPLHVIHLLSVCNVRYLCMYIFVL